MCVSCGSELWREGDCYRVPAGGRSEEDGWWCVLNEWKIGTDGVEARLGDGDRLLVGATHPTTRKSHCASPSAFEALVSRYSRSK
jgi:hypothetical protein